MSEASIEGGCLCGAVRYRLTGELRGFQYCHCSRCRKFTGGPHAANCFVRPGDLEWVSGEANVGTWRLEGKPPFPTGFCRTCGSSMPAMSSTGRFWVVPAGGLDEHPGMEPTRSIFWESRAPWYVPVPDLPRHAELPEG
jgi:hypothetical protein